MDDARQHYEEAVKIDRQLAEQNPAVYLPDLAMSLSNLGRVYSLLGRRKRLAPVTRRLTICCRNCRRE